MNFMSDPVYLGVMVVALIGLIAFYFIQKKKQNDD